MCLTVKLGRCFESQVYQLQLVDLIRELEDEDFIKGNSLRGTSRVTEEFDEGIGKLMPQLTLPEVLEIENEGLKLLRSFVSLLGEEIGDCVGVHFENDAMR